MYVTLDSTTLVKYGFKAATLTDFFKGTTSTYPFSAKTKFEDIAKYLLFSTVHAQLFIAKFEGDYSYLTISVVNKTSGTVSCTMIWTSLNESICSLPVGEFILYGKDSKGKVVIRYPFVRSFLDGGIAADIMMQY